MNTKTIIKYFTLIVFICSIKPLFGQQPDNLNKEVQVTRAYDPIISDANKLDLQIKKDDSLTNIKKHYTYSILTRRLSSHYTIRPIPAATICEQAYTDPHFLYVRLGLGYPLSPLADIYINNYNPKDISVGAYYNLRSVFGSMGNDNSKGYDIPYDELSHNTGAYFVKYFEKFKLKFDAGFNQNNVLFYGYDTNVNSFTDYKVDKDSVKQTYNNIKFNVSIISNNKGTNTDELVFDFNAWFNSFGDRGKNKFNFGRKLAMSENIYGGKLSLEKLFNTIHLFDITTKFNFYNRKLTVNPNLMKNDSTDNRYHLIIEPSYKLIYNKFNIKLGAKLDLANEKDTTKLYIRPQINLAYFLINEFAPYINIDGGRTINSYEKIVYENPYITPGMNFDMKSTLHDYKITFGAKGGFENIFAYNLYAMYSLNKNMYFYRNSDNPVSPVNNYRLFNNFDVVYDEVQEWNIGIELTTNYKNFNALLKANYYNYGLNDLKVAYHRPKFTFNLDANLTIAQYFILSTKIYAQSKTPYGFHTPKNQITYNDGFMNLGLGGEYLFNRTFSTFVNINNLLNKKYMIWNYYKVPGLHFEGGITFKF